MRITYIILFQLLMLLACKQQIAERQSIESFKTDTINKDNTIAYSKTKNRTIHSKKQMGFDTIVAFQGIERIFEDEFNLLFRNDSNKAIKFYYIPGLSHQFGYRFIVESEGYYISNPQWEGKKFQVHYISHGQVNFIGETEIINEIQSITLFQKEDEDSPEILIKQLGSEVEKLKKCMNTINWEEAIRIDSAAILYEEDFMSPHSKRIDQQFIGFNDCSGDSIFKTFYSDRTVQIGGAEPSIFWACDFTLPSLNLRVGDDKDDILAKLGTPSYNFDSILVYPKYIPEIIVKVEGGNSYDDTVFFFFKNNKLIGIIATFYLL